MFVKDKNYISVSLSDQILKLAQVRIFRLGAEVTYLVHRDLKDVDPKEYSRILAKLLSGFNLKKVKALCVVPAKIATTKNIEIPSRDPAEIKSIINLQVGRHTPYSREEIIIGHINGGVYQVNYTKVLLVIVHRKVIKEQLHILEEAGLSVEKVLFAPEGINAFYAQALHLKTQDVPTGIIDVVRQSTDFTVGVHGAVIACRSVSVGLLHLVQDPVGAKQKLLAELKKSVESYEAEDIDQLPKVYIVTDASEKAKDLLASLKKEFKAEIKAVPYSDQMKIAPQARETIREIGDDSFLDIIAPAVMAEEMQIDLIPEEIKVQKALQRQSREAIKLGAQTLIILILMCVLFFNKIYVKSLFLSKLTEDYSQQHTEVNQLEKVAEKTTIVKDYLQGRMLTLEVTRELYRLIPDEIHLENVTFNEDGSVAIRGVSESMSTVFSLITALEESALFKAVKTQSTAAKKERGKDVVTFEIAFKLETAADESEPGKMELKETKK